MTEGKPKTRPIEAIRMIRAHGSISIQVTVDDFIDIVNGKNLTVISLKTPQRGKYYYWACDVGIRYWTSTKRELDGIKVDIVVPKIE